MVGGRRALWCLMMTLAACGDDGPAGSDRSGAGPANVLPLWVPAPGTVTSDTGKRQWVVSEERIIGGKRSFLAGYGGPTFSFESGFGPSEPYFMRTYNRGTDGIYQIADTRYGAYAEPVLVVPDTVRVGMRWYGAPFGERRFTFEVVERSELAKPGEVVWYMEVTDADRISRGPMLSPVYHGETFTLSFVEGSPAGPFAAMPVGIDVDVPGEFIPVENPAAVATFSERGLRALNGGEAISEGIVPSFVGLVSDPAHPERVTLTLEGIGAQWIGGAGVFLSSLSSGCGTMARDGGMISSVQHKDCATVRGSIIDGTGRLLRINDYGWERWNEIESIIIVNGMQSYEYYDYWMGGIFRGADGSAQVFRTGRPGGAVYVAPHPGGPDRLGAMDPLPNATYLGDVQGTRALWLPVEDDTGWTSLLVEGGLKAVHLTRAGVIDVEHTLLDHGGILGLTVDTTGRHMLRSQADGTIERITWDRDGIHRAPLARAIVPAGHAMAGAVEDGERVVVFTVTGFLGRDNQYLLRFSEFDPAVRPQLGTVHAWEMDKP